MRKNLRRLSPSRIAGMTLLLLGVLGTVVGLVRQLPASPWGLLIAGLLGVLVTPIAASPLEWLVHRYVYHRKLIPFMRRIYGIHHVGHHHALFPTWRYVTNGPVCRHPILATSNSALHKSRAGNVRVKASHFLFYMAIASVCLWIPGWLLTGNRGFLVGLVLASALVSDWLVRVHDAIHYPSQHRLIQAQPFFAFLDVHHYIHHVDTEANVNFLLPLADWLFGTMRRTLTAEELARHGSLAEAKAVSLGMSEPARQVASPRRLQHGQ